MFYALATLITFFFAGYGLVHFISEMVMLYHKNDIPASVSDTWFITTELGVINSNIEKMGKKFDTLTVAIRKNTEIQNDTHAFLTEMNGEEVK